MCQLVVFCNAPDDNPFMAGAFHGVPGRCHQCGVSGPGVVKAALEEVRRKRFRDPSETIKRTALR